MTAIYVCLYVVVVGPIRRLEDDSSVLESLEVDRYIVGVGHASRTPVESQRTQHIVVERHERRFCTHNRKPLQSSFSISYSHIVKRPLQAETISRRTFLTYAYVTYRYCVGLHQISCSTSGQVTIWMGDRLWVGKPSRYVNIHANSACPFLRG